MIIVDVGANIGEFSKHVLENNTNAIVYAVEPNKDLCEPQLGALKDFYSNRFTVDYCAIGERTEKGNLYAARVMNGQLGSLFPPNLKSKGWEKHSKHFRDNTNIESIEVQVLSAQDYVEKNDLREIDFLKIDTQGNDIFLLESFLLLSNVKSGVIEVEVGFANLESRYSNSQNDLNKLIEVLFKNNLIITKILPNNSASDEINIFYSVDQSTFSDICESINLSNNPVLSRYWKLQGIGLSENDKSAKMLSHLLAKLLRAIAHPKRSFHSMLVKLTK